MRTINVDGEIYTWEVGRSNAVIRKGDVKHVAPFNILTNMDWSNVERAKYKRYFKVTPKHIRNYILTHNI